MQQIFHVLQYTGKGTLCSSKCPDDAAFLVKSFEEAIGTAVRLYENGSVDKIWVLGGQPVYQVSYGLYDLGIGITSCLLSEKCFISSGF